ncbi:MAG TPA: hypothetical protein VL053_11720 [Arachidicoccus sp.]|nr:hypothetical protein [Arachidicoccus sp.]
MSNTENNKHRKPSGTPEASLQPQHAAVDGQDQERDSFDLQVRGLLEAAELTPPAGIFEKIEARLPRPAIRRRIVLSYAAVIVGVLMILGIVVSQFLWKGPRNISAGSQMVRQGGSLNQFWMRHPMTAIPESLRSIIMADTTMGKKSHLVDNSHSLPLQNPSIDGITNLRQPIIAEGDLVKNKMATSVASNRITGLADRAEKSGGKPGAIAKANNSVQSGGADKYPSGEVDQSLHSTVAALGKAATAVAEANMKIKQPSPSNATALNAALSQQQSKVDRLPGTPAKEPLKTASLQLERTTKGADNDKTYSDVTLTPTIAINKEIEDGSDEKKGGGFFKGLVRHFKHRAKEISEDVVAEYPDRTTVKVGFLAITKYK